MHLWNELYAHSTPCAANTSAVHSCIRNFTVYSINDAAAINCLFAYHWQTAAANAVHFLCPILSRLMTRVIDTWKTQCRSHQPVETFKFWVSKQCLNMYHQWMYATTTTTTPQSFYGPFSGTTRVSWCQKRTSGLSGARED